MDASKRMMLARAMKEARAAKASASSVPAAAPIPPPTLSPPPPVTAEAPFSSSPSSPHSPEALPTPSSPLPIAAVPLAAASSPAPTPLDKGKRVLEILSDDEDSEGVAPFKRRKSAQVPLLLEASPQGGNPFMDDPPSATSLPPPTVQEDGGEGAEFAPPPPPVEVSASPAPVAAAAALDLIAIPPPIMHLMRGFSGGTMPEGTDRKEGMPFYLGAFLAVALEWRAQARNAVLQTQTLQALEAKVTALEEEKKTLGCQNETYQTSLKQAQESKAEAERQLAEVSECRSAKEMWNTLEEYHKNPRSALMEKKESSAESFSSESKKKGHVKTKCPNRRKRNFKKHEKKGKSRRAYNDKSSSSSKEEKANLCLIVEGDNKSSSSSEGCEVSNNKEKPNGPKFVRGPNLAA
ncbi:uncharacterized protein [Phaseolus vulgaris]|uniref:uncharacterized protein n=1 Tax=Phaseolus vulgaris TaxID=3885 RepID=UPI0035CAC015